MVLRRFYEIEVPGEPRRYPELPSTSDPLELVELPVPEPGPGQVLIKVSACGVCHTEIDEIEGRRRPKIPVIPGHQAVGRIVKVGDGVSRVKIGDRVGVAWVGWACGSCTYCVSGLENLCGDFKATGCDLDGCYAEYMVAYEDYVYSVPWNYEDPEAAPLLCGGAIGYRALKLASVKDGMALGLVGFGASAHQIIQVVKHLYPNSKVIVLTRSREHIELARELGADWAGTPQENPPEKIDRAIDFTPIGETIPRIMELLKPGGKLIVNVIRKRTPITLEYTKHLWMEKEIKTVANITRNDIKEYLEIAGKNKIKINYQTFKLEEANKALRLLKQGKIKGAAVLLPNT